MDLQHKDYNVFKTRMHFEGDCKGLDEEPELPKDNFDR